jgi:hypothetical protein
MICRYISNPHSMSTNRLRIFGLRSVLTESFLDPSPNCSAMQGHFTPRTVPHG